MGNKLLRTFLIISLALNISVLITAGYFYFMDDDGLDNSLSGKTARGGHLFNVLSLNKEQRSRMLMLASEFHGGLDRQRAEILPMKVELIDELKKERPDGRKIAAVIERVNAIQRGIEEATVRHLIQSKDVLDKDQYIRLLELIEKSLPEENLPECPL